MKRLLQLSILFITILLVASCGSDSGGPNPEITSVQPDSGPPGTSVTISGKGFRPHGEMNLIFGGTSATLISATEDQIQTEVPESLSEGSAPVEVSVGGATASGPSFMVEAKAPGISSVEPDSGTVGTKVTIKGMNFSSNASDVSISFDGTSAQVKDATEDQLITEVPQGASDGPIEVTVKQKSTTSPPFDVITEGTLEVTTSTSGSDIDADGYTLTVDGSDHPIGTDETITVEDLEEGSYDAELSGVVDNCSVDGDNPRQVDITAGNTTTISFDITCEAVLKDQILFLSSRDNSNDLYVTNPDGTDQQRITNSFGKEYHPSVSPDGTKIAYTDGSDKNIYVVNADGSDRTQLTSSSGLDLFPRWSPDGSQIVFTTDRDGDYEVYIMNADGSDQTNLTNSPNSIDLYASWSPDGDRIAFASDRDSDGDYEIYTANTEGTALQKLTDNTVRDDHPAYSPDGSQIAFTSQRDGNAEIYVMDADGSSLQRVTNHSGRDDYASWSPDGSQIAFHSVGTGNTEVYIINTDGTGATNLTVNAAEDVWPFWSPIK